MHEKISLAVDLLLFTIRNDRLELLLVRKLDEPFSGMLALPGVAVSEDETLTDATRRCLKEKMGISEELFMEQLFTWGDDLDRDPRNRVVSVSYYALIPYNKLSEYQEEKEKGANFYDVDYILSDKIEMAFDHKKITEYARERIRGKADYTDIGFSLLDEEFTLPDLQRVYEILLGKPLYKANFRKSIADKVEETGELRREGACRPSKLYRKK